MPPTTPRREVIEITDSPIAWPEFIEISDDDEVTELLDYRAKQISIPHIPPIQPAYVPDGDGNLESMKSESVDTKGPGDLQMVSPGLATSFQSLSSGHEGLAGEGSYLDMLDRELGEISREIGEDQASMTAHIFQDAYSKVQLESKFTKIPYNMRSQRSLEQLPQDEASTPSVTTIHHDAKKTLPPTLLQPKIIPSQEKAVPKYNYYVEIERSTLANRTLLPPEPSDLDNNSNSKEKVEAARLKSQLLCANLAKQSRRSENLSRIGAYLPQIRSAYQVCRNSLEEEGIYETLDHKDVMHPSYRVERAFGIPPGSFFALETPAVKPQKSSTYSLDPLAKTLERYARESCLICFAHQCLIHGIFEDGGGNGSDASDTTDEHSASEGDSDKYQLYSMPHSRMRTSYRGRNSIGNESEDDSDCGEQSRRNYCSVACHLNPSNAEFNNEGTWTEKTDATMQVLAKSMRIRKNRKASCLIAPMLGKPCSEVHHHLKKLSSERVGLDDMVAGDDRRSKKFDWRDLRGEHAHHKRLQPMPCYHPGQNCLVAGEKCTCVSNGVCCDKFCTCPQSCYARYPGCTCTEPCLLRKCLCRRLNRECDPDLCHGCNAAESVKSQGPISDTNCHNCDIQRAQAKRVLVGESSIEGIGNGLYMAEPVQEGEFIAEYVGEIINNAEVDRREALVKRIGSSYNFTLNTEVVIDAMWFGNATRFINHSEVRQNCRAEVLLVNSEHRIAFYAKEKINAGEELFFNYGDDFKSIENLKEGVVSPNASTKSSKQQRKEPQESPIANTKSGIGSRVDESDEGDDVFGGFADWHAKQTERKRASDDDDDYIEGGYQQGPKRSRLASRSRRGRR